MAVGDVELWSKSAAAQLDAQLRERRRNFSRRIEAIDRIQQAAGGLEDRIQDIDQQEAALSQVELKLIELTDYLIASNQPLRSPVDIEFA
jgi:septal ring factor EnvC (AmiA/AmiB activator)